MVTYEFYEFFSINCAKISLFIQQSYLVNQLGGPEVSLEHRETESDSYKKELVALRPEIELIKSEVRGVPAYIVSAGLHSFFSVMPPMTKTQYSIEMKWILAYCESTVTHLVIHKVTFILLVFNIINQHLFWPMPCLS